MKIIIIGGGTAGLAASIGARRTDRNAEIKIIGEEKHYTCSRCGLPYVLEGKIKNFEKLIVHDRKYYEGMKVDFILDARVAQINAKEKKIIFEKEEKGKKERKEEKYDKLIIATGSKPIMPPIEGVNKKGVFSLRTLEDGKALMEYAKGKKKAVIGGGKFVGLETASALKHLGLEVTVVEMLPQILFGIFDEDMAGKAQTLLEAKGIRFVLGKKVEKVLGKEKVEKIIAGGEEIEADVFIMGFGVLPNVELAKNSGIALGETGAITVNEKMETNLEDVYTAGDCIEVVDAINEKPVKCMLGTTAFHSGYCAGVNSAGGNEKFPKWACASVSKVFGYEFASVGITEKQAKDIGMNGAGFSLTGNLRAEYYSEKEEDKIIAKLVAEKGTGRVLGAQFIGRETSVRASYIAQLIRNKGTLDDLIYGEFAYCPAVADVVDPIVMCAKFLKKKI